MPSIFTHTLVGIAAGKILPQEPPPKRFWVLSIVLPSLPDADVISFMFELPYQHVLGHRGITHSILFALLIGCFAVTVLFRGYGLSPKRATLLAAYFALVTASHGILDGVTNGSLGVAFFAPLDNTRYFFHFRPIESSPIGLAFFTERGYTAIKSEIVWVWIPVLSGILLKVVLARKLMDK